jgi:uncharacterized protein (TIGR04206 family)
MAPASDRPDLILLSSLFVVPWVLLTYGSVFEGPTTLLFAWGLFDPATGSGTNLYRFLFAYTRGLPNWILAWPLGAICLIAAFANAVRGVARGREDVRVTASLLVLVGVAALSVAWGFSGQPGRTGLPLGTVVAWLLAGRYWRRIRG